AVVPPSLHTPATPNCCEPPACTVALRGPSRIPVRTGPSNVIVTTAVSARVPPCSVAMTWNVPGVEPAVYFPSLLMAPPVADQLTEGAPLPLSLQTPLT